MNAQRWILVAALLHAGCGAGEVDNGESTTRTEEGLSGCKGHASSTVASSGNYFLTTFGGAGDTQTMSCGGLADASWYYAASRQRFGCGAHIQIEANGKCVVAQTDDYGPDVCVEKAAGAPIIDASPLVAQHLFGSSSAGWSDHFAITVTAVAKSTPLGPCQGGPANNPPPNNPPPNNPPPNNPPPNNPPPNMGQCYSGTLARSVDDGTCIQSASDGAWHECSQGAWVAGQSSCAIRYPYCHSSTLGKDVPARTCVQSVHDQVWYQCDSTGWSSPVANGAGPAGPCATEYPL